MKDLAANRDRVGSLSLLIAPALIVTPYERLQTQDRRKNPQRDYARFADARIQFDRVMGTSRSGVLERCYEIIRCGLMLQSGCGDNAGPDSLEDRIIDANEVLIHRIR
jgi:hypothetical protein